MTIELEDALVSLDYPTALPEGEFVKVTAGYLTSVGSLLKTQQAEISRLKAAWSRQVDELVAQSGEIELLDAQVAAAEELVRTVEVGVIVRMTSALKIYRASKGDK